MTIIETAKEQMCLELYDKYYANCEWLGTLDRVKPLKLIISHAFDWYDTEEGIAYWLSIHTLWHDYIK